MARKTIVSYYSDLSGDAVEKDGATVLFELDGTGYEIDLTAGEQEALRSALSPYVAAARKVGSSGRRRTTSTPAPSSEPSAKDIRSWATENGHDVPARGRIPIVVMEAYKAAH